MDDKVLRSLGKLVTDETLARDAVHIAVAPVIAAEPLEPGEHVGLNSEGQASAAVTVFCGIVDPYLTSGQIQTGEKFWLFLYPGSIQSLRHEWTHPAFPEKDGGPSRAAFAKAKRWLTVFALNLDADVDELIEGAVSGEGYTFGTTSYYDYFEDAGNQFWDHVETVTGKRPIRDNNIFSCSC